MTGSAWQNRPQVPPQTDWGTAPSSGIWVEPWQSHNSGRGNYGQQRQMMQQQMQQRGGQGGYGNGTNRGMGLPGAGGYNRNRGQGMSQNDVGRMASLAALSGGF